MQYINLNFLSRYIVSSEIMTPFFSRLPTFTWFHCKQKSVIMFGLFFFSQSFESQILPDISLLRNEILYSTSVE